MLGETRAGLPSSGETHRIGKVRLSPENLFTKKAKQRRLFQAEGTACAKSPGGREEDRQVWGEFMVAVPRGKKDLTEAGTMGLVCILESSLCLLGGGSEEDETKALQHPGCSY